MRHPGAPAFATNARAGDEGEVQPEVVSPFPTANTGGEAEASGTQLDETAIELCERLAASLAARKTPAIIDRPDGWRPARAAWIAAAPRILADYPPTRVAAAIDLLSHDYVLGSQIRTMPALADRIDEVMLRQPHRPRLASPPDSPAAGAPAWPEAWQAIERLIRRHGTGGGPAARAALADQHPTLAAFVDRVGWSQLCRDDYTRRQVDWKLAYRDIVQAAHPHPQAA